jgi:peroxiredoxin
MTLQRILLGLVLGLMTTLVWAEAPSIELRDPDGKTRNVNEFIGHDKWTVVVTWAHDCYICAQEIGEMAAFHTAHQERDAIVLGVSVDGYDQADLARTFIAAHKLPFVNLIAEPEQEVLMRFGAGRFVGTPTYYIYDPKGEIVGQNIGPLTRNDVEKFITSFNSKAHEPEQPAGK